MFLYVSIGNYAAIGWALMPALLPDGNLRFHYRAMFTLLSLVTVHFGESRPGVHWVGMGCTSHILLDSVVFLYRFISLQSD